MKHSDKKPLGCGGTYVAIMSSLVFAGLLYQAIKNPGRQNPDSRGRRFPHLCACHSLQVSKILSLQSQDDIAFQNSIAVSTVRV
jgi:hypothetical protein